MPQQLLSIDADQLRRTGATSVGTRKIELADDGQILVDKSRRFQFELGQWLVPESSLRPERAQSTGGHADVLGGTDFGHDILSPWLSAPHDFGVDRWRAVMLENASPQCMRTIGAFAVVGQRPTPDAGARNIAMQQRSRGAIRLRPVDVLQVAKPHFRCLPSIPFALHPDDHLGSGLHQLLHKR
jgi:hypothetical protein